MTLSGKRIVVLGGSSGIGLATAQAAARDKANVVIASSRKDRMEAALVTLPKGTQGHVLDLADGEAIRASFAELGDFDHLVFTAGETLQLGNIAATEVEAARRFFALRYWGAYCAAKYGSGNIRKGGLIVFTSGVAGQRLHAGWAVAASICSAVEGLARALAVELAPRPRQRRLPWRGQNATMGKYAGSGSRGALPADARTAAGRARWRAGEDCWRRFSTSCGRAMAPAKCLWWTAVRPWCDFRHRYFCDLMPCPACVRDAQAQADIRRPV